MSGEGAIPPAGTPPPPAYTADNTYQAAGNDIFRNIAIFDIRNGPPELAVSLLVRPAIPAAYKWVRINNLPPGRAIAFVDAFVAEHYWYLGRHNVPGMDEPKRRKAAIALGVARAVATSYYDLQENDFIAGEVVSSVLTYRAPVAATTNPAAPAVAEGLNYVTGTANDVQERISRGLTYTQLEQDVMASLIRTTVGIIPVQGFSLLDCGHHYISTPGHQSYRAFLAIEKQHWKEQRIAEWFATDEEFLRDVFWHKACHPVNTTIKVRAAVSENVKTQLVTAGAGAAAARLPATEGGVRAAKAYMQLFDVLRPLWGSFEGAIDAEVFDIAMRTLSSLPPGDENAPEGWVRPEGVPVQVTNRRSCLRWIGEVVNRNSSMAAQCYGFYCAMTDAGMALGSAAANDTLRNAYSLKKLMTTHIPTYTLGYQSYGDYASAKAKQRKAGVYVAPQFVAI